MSEPRNRDRRERRRLVKLWAKDAHCYWCKKETILISISGGKAPKNSATIDHLRSRYHPLRTAPKSHQLEERTVLSCWQCNNDRCKAETASMPKEYLQARSGSKPQNVPFHLVKYNNRFEVRLAFDGTTLSRNLKKEKAAIIVACLNRNKPIPPDLRPYLLTICWLGLDIL